MEAAAMDLDTAASSTTPSTTRPVSGSRSATAVPTPGLDVADSDTTGRVAGVANVRSVTMVPSGDATGGGSGRAGSDSGGFELEIPVVTGVAGIFAAESTSLTELAANLQARLAQHGPCWGDDVVGTRFGAAYSPAATIVAANIAALAAGLERIGSALRAVAENYGAADGLFAAATSNTGSSISPNAGSNNASLAPQGLTTPASVTPMPPARSPRPVMSATP
jgi:uncharacterized protein YukE